MMMMMMMTISCVPLDTYTIALVTPLDTYMCAVCGLDARATIKYALTCDV